MKRYNNFIVEELEVRPDTKVLSDDEFIKCVSENCKEFNVDSVSINRYVNLPQDRIYLIDPSLTMRKSRDNLNIYTLIMDNTPEWSDYPKRSFSLICTIKKYNNAFLVVPFDNAKFGVCRYKPDIWNIFNEKFERMKLTEKYFPFNSALLENIANVAYQIFDRKFNDDTYDAMCTDLSKMEEYLTTFIDNTDKLAKITKRYGHDTERLLKFYLYLKTKKLTFIKFFEKLYSVNNRSFALTTYNEIQENSKKFFRGPNEYDAAECWTDSKCILIPRNFLYRDSIYDKALHIKKLI